MSSSQTTHPHRPANGPFARGLSFYSRTPSRKAKQKARVLHRDSSYDAAELPRPVSRITQQEAEAIEHELTQVYCFSAEQQLELLGLACAVAFCKAYTKESLKKAHGAFLVCCGPGMNGATGLVCARHLKMFGYRPTVYCAASSGNRLVNTLVAQCEKVEIPFLGYLPSDRQLINDGYNAVVDSVFGFRFKPPVREDYEHVINMLKRIKIPILSIDVPSGWDVENGNPDGIQPDCLVSLIAPKKCARYFKGRMHFVGGRFVPRLLAQKFDLSLPNFVGSEPCAELAALTAGGLPADGDKETGDSPGRNTGEKSDRPGKELNDDVWGATD